MIFLTGGTGLLGSHILVELTKRNQSVVALKRSNSSLNNVENVFHHFFKDQAAEKLKLIQWADGDILDITSLENAMRGCDRVYHAAGLVSFKKKDFKRLMKVNKEGTANVVNTALDLGIKRFCHVSSTAAIAHAPLKSENDESNKWTTNRSNSNYAVSKYSAENEVWRGKEEGLEVVIVNPSVILGIGELGESSLSLFKTIKNGLKFYTHGINAFVDARDVAYILCELDARNITNERFLTISENKSYKWLFENIAEAFKVKAPSIAVKKWMAAIAWRLVGTMAFLFGTSQNITKETAQNSLKTIRYSNEKIKNALGGYSFIPIKESINHAVAYFQKKN